MSASNRTTSLNAFLHVSHEELHIQWRIDNWQKQLFHQQLYLLIMSYNPFGWEVLSERRNMRTEDLQIFLNPLPFFFASSVSLLLPINNLLCVFAAAIRWCNQQSSMILRVSREIQHKFPNSFYVHAGIESTPIPPCFLPYSSADVPPISIHLQQTHILRFFQSCCVHLVECLRYVVSLLASLVRHAPHLVLRVLFAAIACASVWLLDDAEKGYYPSTTASNTGVAVAGWWIQSNLLQLKHLSIPTDGIIAWYDRDCSTTVDSD